MRAIKSTIIILVFCFCFSSGEAADSGKADKKFSLTNPFFAFDNGVGRGSMNPIQQASLLKELGYAGIGYSGSKDIENRYSAFDRKKLKIFSLYVWSRVGPKGPTYDPNLKKAIKELKGRDVILWLTVQGKAPDGEAQAVKVVREIGDLAKESNLKVALYPHLGFYVSTVEDGLRIARKVKRKNVGTSFNLCHWLKENDEKNMALRLKQVLPYLFLVSINGADHKGGWDRLIQTLDKGDFDVFSFLKELKMMGYKGPVGLQCYNVKGDIKKNLKLLREE